MSRSVKKSVSRIVIGASEISKLIYKLTGQRVTRETVRAWIYGGHLDVVHIDRAAGGRTKFWAYREELVDWVRGNTLELPKGRPRNFDVVRAS